MRMQGDYSMKRYGAYDDGVSDDGVSDDFSSSVV